MANHSELFYKLVNHSTVHSIRYGVFDNAVFVWVYSTDAELLRSYIDVFSKLNARVRIAATDMMRQYICFDVIDDELLLAVKMLGDNIVDF